MMPNSQAPTEWRMVRFSLSWGDVIVFSAGQKKAKGE